MELEPVQFDPLGFEVKKLATKKAALIVTFENRSDVRVVRELSKEEVSKYLASIQQMTSLPTPPVSNRAMSPEEVSLHSL